MEISVYLIVIVVSSAVWLTWNAIKRPKNYPPGPEGIFSFFQLHRLNEPMLHKAMQKISKRFGLVNGFFIWHRKMVTVNGHWAVKEALADPKLSGRPVSFDFNLRTKGRRLGVLMTEGELWRDQRRFSLRHLKDLGFGKSSMEDVMLDEIDQVLTALNEIASRNGNAVLLDDVYTSAVFNVLWAVVAGKRFEINGDKIRHLISCMDGFMRLSNGGPNIRAVLPQFISKYVAPDFCGYNQMMSFIQPLRTYIEEEVNEHKATRQPNAARDFIDVYLEAIDNDPSKDFHEEQLLGIIFDIMVAGSETTSHTLGFALLYMIRYPQIQSKVQEEIDRVLSGRPPSLSDRSRLPFTEATLTEIQRIGIVAPLTVPHVAEEDTTCQGYFIPKGTMVFINLWSAHMDESVWPEANTFNPERHLQNGGQTKSPSSPHVLTFGLGKRSCIGETLARATLFIFFVSTMQRCRIEEMEIENDDLAPSLEPIAGLTLAPRPCMARLFSR